MAPWWGPGPTYPPTRPASVPNIGPRCRGEVLVRVRVRLCHLVARVSCGGARVGRGRDGPRMIGAGLGGPHVRACWTRGAELGSAGQCQRHSGGGRVFHVGR